MDLIFTQAQRAYRRRLRDWIAANLPDEWKHGLFRGPADEGAAVEIEREWDRRLYQAGYAGVAWPKEYGGQGLSVVEQFILNEELGRVAAPEGISTIGVELAGPILLAAGTGEQKQRYIREILSGDAIWCQGFSEPNAGSDLASLRTTAVRHEDGWLINGQKVWTTHAPHADFCLLLARTNPDVPNSRGLTLFIVPMDLPGITARPLTQITGRNEFAEVFFEDVRIPLDSHVGPVDQGWQVANGVLEIERGTMKLYRQARFTHELEGILKVAQQARPGQVMPAAADDFRQRIATIYAELAIFRYHNLKLVSRIAAGERIGADASVSKLFWSEMHQRLAALGFDVLGDAASAIDDASLSAGRYQELILHCRFETISSGTSQIQRTLIAERILGLPR